MPKQFPLIFFKDQARPERFTQSGRPVKQKIPSRPGNHGQNLEQKWNSLWEAAEENEKQRVVQSLPVTDGVYIEFESGPNAELITQSLEDRTSKVSTRLANVRTRTLITGEEVTLATIFVPKVTANKFLSKINAFNNELTSKGKPKNDKLMRSIEDMRIAVLESFWMDDLELMPSVHTPVWCEVWLVDADQTAEDRFRHIFQDQLELPLSPNSLKFPERTVLLARVTRLHLLEMIESCSNIAEFRRAKETADFFVSMGNSEQATWVEALLQQLDVDQNSNVAVCLLDSGVNNRHALLRPVLQDEDCLTVSPAWGTHDHEPHGTHMCGLAAYGDLTDILPQAGTINVRHILESVKILPPNSQNPQNLYGYITQQGVSTAEIKAPYRKRIISMSVTSEDGRDRGRPSSWSAALDQLTSGALEEDSPKRLFFVSAGNLTGNSNWIRYPESNKDSSIHDPGQSWNAITVGAYTRKCFIQDTNFYQYTPLSQPEQLSPFSTTSIGWEKKWPIKPEIVLEGGNTAHDGAGACSTHEDLQLLTTSSQPQSNQFATCHATSASTALAARMAAQIQVEYPDAWPETIRALMVHSAEWPDALKKQIIHSGARKSDYASLLRFCGYGVPDFNKAVGCMKNSATLVVQDTIQPYEIVGSDKKTKEMNLYELPWPKEVLLALGAEPISIRFTLSYFIEPGPGEVGWKHRYRYPSYGLRFQMNDPLEDAEAFRKRINAAAREEDEKISCASESGRWLIGISRNVGSIHSDIWSGSAADAASCNLVAIHPVIGWWRERAHLKKWGKLARYSLIISITTTATDVDIYTPVATQIGIPISV